MNSLTRIFVAEQDCESLVNTMLWLEQYPDFEIYGTDFAGAPLNEQIEEVQPDIVMLGMGASGAQATLSIKGIRSTSVKPAVLLVTKSDTTELVTECDGQMGPKTSLKEMPELIRKAINRSKLAALATVSMPMAKAG